MRCLFRFRENTRPTPLLLLLLFSLSEIPQPPSLLCVVRAARHAQGNSVYGVGIPTEIWAGSEGCIYGSSGRISRGNWLVAHT